MVCRWKDGWCLMEQEGGMVLCELEVGMVLYEAGRMDNGTWNVRREILCHINLREAWCGMVWSRKEG